MAKIITKSNSDEIAGWITKFLSSSSSTLVRLEGVCGSGKTTIGRKLSERGVGLHINVDKFATKPSKPTPYPQCLKQEELNGAITRAIGKGKTVILDAVCLEEVAPVELWGHGLSRSWPPCCALFQRRSSFEKRSIEGTIETGRLLTVAKDQCAHGEYQDWLAKEFGWTQRTATRIRNLYDFVQNGHKVYFGKKIDIKRLNISPTALYLVASISNADAIKAVLSAAAKGRVSVARASEIIAEHDRPPADDQDSIGPDPPITPPVEPPIDEEDGDDDDQPPAPPLPLDPDDEVGRALHVLSDIVYRDWMASARTLTEVQLCQIVDRLETGYREMVNGDPIKEQADRAEAKSRMITEKTRRIA